MKQVKSSRNGVANLFTDLKGLVTGKGKRGKAKSAQCQRQIHQFEISISL